MNEKVIESILDLQKKNHCLDQSLAEYLLLTNRLDNTYFKSEEETFDKKEIETEMQALFDHRTNLINNLLELIKLIEQLDIELRQSRGDAL
ncbi:MAG: hypothetical protein UIB63_08735 [Methanobrevibacter sp.]|uniref:hypothetical protein n=1 Tax=Methanobrevibacter sp. TaxID=66852 RepID=UPI002E7A34D6|nr:hypothetical protein [Methanobrevibacter sp.]MEE0943183.1 hypothetical protein [Methanobrevibacter sp.]